jgi:2-polyprenyl-6-hydroxyphenyl methylase/3-demethylubiquinone-9 3-methyltransferase
MAEMTSGRVYSFENAAPMHSHRYLQRPLYRAINNRNWPSHTRALDYGCGNGSFAGWLAAQGFNTVGVDISESGIELARRAVPSAEFTLDNSLENLLRLGPFDLVTCIEVIAHCYNPSNDLKKMFLCLRPGGTLVLATPYHGYAKNLAMALTGNLERHLDTSWSGAYVHFFTPLSISKLLEQAGFRSITVTRAGRIAPLAKSMILTCSKPAA